MATGLITKPFRHDFEPVLARLLRNTVRDGTKRRDGIFQTIPNNLENTPLFYLKRFIEIDCAWMSDQVTRILERRETQRMDAVIARLQKNVDDNAPEPGESRRKEIRKEKARNLAFADLKPQLAARALRQLEHDLEMVTDNGLEDRNPTPDFSIGLQYLPYTLSNHDKLMAQRRERIKGEKREATMAVKAFRTRVKAAQKGKEFSGHWEFENVEEEVVGRTFMRKNETHEGPITADDVFREQLAQDGVAVILEVQLKFVEDGGDEPEGSKRKKSKTKSATAKQAESIEHWNEDGAMITPEHLPKKSLIVKLPIDFSRLNVKKRKQSPSSNTTSAPKTKKQNMTAPTAVEPKVQQLENEIQQLTVQWMRQIYQDPAMSNPGFKDVSGEDDDGDQSDSSGLSDPPDCDLMDVDD